MKLSPITLRKANAFVAEHHRHHKPCRGHKFSIGALDGDELVGVVIVGRPVARESDDGFTAEVTRLCAKEGLRKITIKAGKRKGDQVPLPVCSFLYGAAVRAAKAMGYVKVQTYLLDWETGTSVRESGFVAEAKVQGRDWNCPSRRGRRTDQPQDDKIRWARAI